MATGITGPDERLAAADTRIAPLRSARVRLVAAPLLAAAALALALATQFAYTEGADIPRLWLGFVAAALVFAAAAYVIHVDGKSTQATAQGPLTISPRVEWLLLAAIIGIAIFFRFFRLDSFPPGLWYDEGVNGTDAITIIERDHLTVWRESNFGHSTIYFYLLIASFKTFGFTVFAMRFVPAVAGLAAVFAFYFLARWLTGVVPALIATALLAVGRWAVTFSRISWEASLMPLLEIMSVFFLVRALETKNRFYYFMAGGSLAAGLYTYLAFRFVPLVMAFFLAYIAITQWKLIRDNLPGLVLYALSFAIVVFPLGQFALQNQDQFLERTRAINVFKEIDEKGSYDPLWSNLEDSLKMMNVRGDHNGRHNLPNAPMLDEITGALLVLGFAAAVWSLRNWRRGTVAGWYVLALLPGAFTITIENPSAIRGVGAIPPLYLLAALALSTMYGAFNRTRAGLYAFGALAILLIGASTAINYYDLFERQAKDQEVYDAFTPDFMLVGQRAAAAVDDHDVYISRDYEGHPAVRTLMYHKKDQRFSPGTELVLPDKGRDVLLLLDPRQLGAVPAFQQLYPNLRQDDYIDRFGRLQFSRINIPVTDLEALHTFPASVSGGPGGGAEGLPLDHAWTAEDIANGPVTVTWRGFFWSASSPGETEFNLRGQGALKLEIGGQTLDAPTGDLKGTVTLPYGEVPFTLTMTVTSPGRLDGSVVQDRRVSRRLEGFYSRSVGESGFRVFFRQPGFDGAPAGEGRVPFAAPIDWFPNARGVEYQGYFQVATPGTYDFALDGANSAQLLVDGVLIVDNGGSHGARRAEGSLSLAPGRHLLTVQYTVADRPNWALFMRAPDADWKRLDGTEFSPPSGPFVPPAVVTIEFDNAWGAAGRSFAGFDHLTGVAVMPDGRIVIVSKDSVGVVASDFSVTTLSVSASDITDVDVSASGRILVLDGGSKSLIVLRPDGTEERRLDAAFATAAGVGVAGEVAYVASPSGGYIYRIDLDSGAVSQIPLSKPDAPVRANQPSDVAAPGDGTLYIADFEKKTIVVSKDEGASAVAYGGLTGTGVQLPHLAALGKLLYATDPLNQRIVVYDSLGKQRGVLAFPLTTPPIRPMGIDIAGDETLFVADLESGRVYKLSVNIPDELRAELAQQ
jgi:4-amino-4-deoxy-L-arabinose transferase-like glycosyltransferase